MFPAALAEPMMAPYFEGDGSVWLVAGPSPEPLGFVYCAPEALTEGTWNMRAIGVDPSAQGRGIGSALIAAAEVRLAGSGARLIVVETSDAPDQDRARALYPSRGYVERGRIPDFWGPGVAKLILSKAI